MIYELTSTLEVQRIIDLGRDVVKAPIEILRKKIINAITHQDSKVFIYRNKDAEIKGFIFGTMEEMDGEDCVFIQMCVVDPKHIDRQAERLLTLELVAKINEWAKERGIKTMYFLTHRNPAAFERKFKFKLDYFLMKRSVQ